MTDEPEEPPTIIKLVPPPADPMKERGARPVEPPQPERRSAFGPEASELAELVTRVITVRGGRKENLLPHWIAAEALQIADPHRQTPPLVRQAARITLRDLATEEMRAYRPPPDALKVLEEDEQAQEVDICRKAAQEAEAHRLRCVPLTCGLCGKKAADERGSLIIQCTPPIRICETCIVTTIVAALQRRWAAEASARAAKALEAACVRDSQGPPRPRGKR
jgi:hypothetical protein